MSEPVFGHEIASMLEHCYGSMHYTAQPDIYWLATGRDYHLERENLSAWLDLLSAPQRRAILNTVRQKCCTKGYDIWQTYSEVGVGASLARKGFAVEYEPHLAYSAADQGRIFTPDWLATIENTRIVCEVFTSGLSEEGSRQRRLLHDLGDKVSQIRSDSAIEISLGPIAPTMNTALIEQLVLEVGDWLRTQPSAGQCCQPTQGILFRILDSDGRQDRSGSYLISGGSYRVSTSSLFNKLRKKARKYKAPITILGLPLVVAAVAGRATGQMRDTLADAVLGTVEYLADIDHDRVLHRRKPDGLFSLSREYLSAVLWARKSRLDCDAPPLVILNPAARYPLSAEQLPGCEVVNPT